MLVRIASYGPKIGQSHGENRLSHIIMYIIFTVFLYTVVVFLVKGKINE